MTQTAQSGRHAALLTALGAGYETFTHDGAWHAYWDTQAIPAGTYDERMLAWINVKLSTSYTNLPRAMQALAEAGSFFNFSSMTTLSL